jgi:NADPH:quinone reductase-like Zn-dependent oxidoreductase
VSRINTIIDFEAVATKGVSGDGTATVASAAALGEMAALVADGEVEVPIAATFALADVRDAYRRLAERHTRGKIVLVP